jgi:hypothetical protein
MAILVKCNAADLSPGDEFSITLPKEKGVGLTQGLEVFVWVSESPRPPIPKGCGLEMRGELVCWEPTGREVTVTIHVNERLSGGLGMDAFMNALAHHESDAALRLRHIAAYRLRRIWGLSAGQRQLLYEAFRGSSR